MTRSISGMKREQHCHRRRTRCASLALSFLAFSRFKLPLIFPVHVVGRSRCCFRYTRRLQQRADAIGLTHFCGTNTIFFVPALRDCLGVVTGLLSEDTPTGEQLARLGWDAHFVDQALAVGTVSRQLRAECISCCGMVGNAGGRGRWRVDDTDTRPASKHC